jgi:large subunit ribosomal protein L27
MAHKKAQWSTQNGRDSNSKRLGIKLFWWEKTKSWNIIVRQKWNKFWPWIWTEWWKDFTIFAVKDWVVYFTEKNRTRFDWSVHKDIYVNIKN